MTVDGPASGSSMYQSRRPRGSWTATRPSRPACSDTKCTRFAASPATAFRGRRSDRHATDRVTGGGWCSATGLVKQVTVPRPRLAFGDLIGRAQRDPRGEERLPGLPLRNSDKTRAVFGEIWRFDRQAPGRSGERLSHLPHGVCQRVSVVLLRPVEDHKDEAHVRPPLGIVAHWWADQSAAIAAIRFILPARRAGATAASS